MTIHPAFAALIAVMTVGNVYLLGRHFRRRYARFFGPPKTIDGNTDVEFGQLNAFLDALHLLVHDYGVEITAIGFDEKTRVYTSISLGEVRCDADEYTRARDYKVAATMLNQDADELYAQWLAKQPKVEAK